jgi:hypothetical protein
MTRSARNSAATRARRTVTESQTACQLHCATQTRARNSPDPFARYLAACDRVRLISQPVHFLEARASLSFLGRGYYNCTPLCLLPRQSSRSPTFPFRVHQAIHLPEPGGSLASAAFFFLTLKSAASDHSAVDRTSRNHYLAHHVDHCNCASTSKRCWSRRSLPRKKTKPKPQSCTERPRGSDSR